MKKIYKTVLILFSICLLSVQGFATNLFVTVENFSFTPSNFAVSVGDTITWIWLSGTHTCTSDNIPVGAASWDAPMGSGSPSFVYIVSVAGSYQYHCTPHQSMGMTGGFLASSTTDIDKLTRPGFSFNVWQSSSDKSINLKFNSGAEGSAEFFLMDLSGKVIYKNTLAIIETGTRVNFNTPVLPLGIYLAEIRSATKREVKRVVLY